MNSDTRYLHLIWQDCTLPPGTHVEHIPCKKGKRGSYIYFICTTMKNTHGTHCDAKRMSMRSLDQTVIENLLAHILTMVNLRPLAVNIAQSLEERSSDAGTRIMALEDELAEVQKLLDNILDAIEKMGYAKHPSSITTNAAVRKKNRSRNWRYRKPYRSIQGRSRTSIMRPSKAGSATCARRSKARTRRWCSKLFSSSWRRSS